MKKSELRKLYEEKHEFPYDAEDRRSEVYWYRDYSAWLEEINEEVIDALNAVQRFEENTNSLDPETSIKVVNALSGVSMEEG